MIKNGSGGTIDEPYVKQLEKAVSMVNEFIIELDWVIELKHITEEYQLLQDIRDRLTKRLQRAEQSEQQASKSHSCAVEEAFDQLSILVIEKSELDTQIATLKQQNQTDFINDPMYNSLYNRLTVVNQQLEEASKSQMNIINNVMTTTTATTTTAATRNNVNQKKLDVQSYVEKQIEENVQLASVYEAELNKAELKLTELQQVSVHDSDEMLQAINARDSLKRAIEDCDKEIQRLFDLPTTNDQHKTTTACATTTNTDESIENVPVSQPVNNNRKEILLQMKQDQQILIHHLNQSHKEHQAQWLQIKQRQAELDNLTTRLELFSCDSPWSTTTTNN